jgi:hypothetical protein
MSDMSQNFWRNGLPTFIRFRNFPDIQQEDWAALGFSIAPSGSQVGTTDILVNPQPTITPVSVHNIGQSMGKLRFGAKQFRISQTFVQKMMAQRGIATPQELWRDPTTVGLVMEGLLFSIEDVKHYDVGGCIMAWVLTCNANEIR